MGTAEVAGTDNVLFMNKSIIRVKSVNAHTHDEGRSPMTKKIPPMNSSLFYE